MAQTPDQSAAEPASRKSFAALRHRGFRGYFIGAALAMMADNIEHVISYWIIFEKFQSPALGGFAVISHWLPFLLFSFYAGALADRFDPRRIIQVGMVMFMAVSLAWGVLIFTDTLEMWHAAVLLVIHGFAGVLWSPAGQLLVHDIVGPAHLQSAVRLTATSRNIGLLMGPAVGAGLMLVLGSALGILVNALIYIPLALWLWKAPYGPRFRKSGAPPPPRRRLRGFADFFDTMRSVAGIPVLVSMVLLAGAVSLLVGNAHQAQMPEFARDLGYGNTGLFYSILLAANAAGALIAGLVLEGKGLLPPRPTTAFVLAFLWCVAIAGFAAAAIYPLAVALMFVAGFLNLSYSSMTQTLVQLNAPDDIRGRVIGLYSMSGNGLKTFSGMTVGLGGSVIGIHWSLGLSAAMLMIAIMALVVYAMRTNLVRAAE